MALSHQSSANVQQFPYVRVCPCVSVCVRVHLTESFELALPFAAGAVPLPNGALATDAMHFLFGRSFGANQLHTVSS